MAIYNRADERSERFNARLKFGRGDGFRRLLKLLRHCPVFLFILSLLPIVAVGIHARPGLDDYTFSALSSFRPQSDVPIEYYIQRSVRHSAENGNFFDVFTAVGRTVFDNYFEWQGTYSAITLFSAHPAVLFGAYAYPLTMLFTIFALIISTAFLCKTLLGENWLLPCILILTCSIQWLPHIAQGFFWYNGAVYYTFFYSLLLFNLTLQIRLLKNGEISVFKIIPITFLCFFIGGGNFVSALLSVELNALLLLYAVFQNKKKYLPFAIFTFASLVGLIISAAAPGNAVRGELASGISFSIVNVVRTVIVSLGLAVNDIIVWTSPGVLLLLVAAIPIMLRIVKGINFDFRFPLIVTGVSFLLFASQNAPPIHALQYGGDPKLRNIVYFAYIWFIFGNIGYWLGWLSKKIDFKKEIFNRTTCAICICIWIAALPFGFGIELSAENRGLAWKNENTPTTLLTFNDLRNRLPQRFLEEHRTRQHFLENSTGSLAEVEIFSAMPLTLVPFQPIHHESGHVWPDLTHNPLHWTNRSIAAYYGVRFVVALPPEKTVARVAHREIGTNDRSIIIEELIISDMSYFRLRDLAYILHDAFDVEFFGGQFALNTNNEYTPVGGECVFYPSESSLLPAYLHSETIYIDGILHEIPGYLIRGEIFHRADILDLVGISAGNRNGTLFLYPAENTDIKIEVTIDNRQVEFPGQPPKNLDGRIYVPVQDIFEMMGYVVTWNSRQMILTGDSTIILSPESFVFTVNGENHNLDAPAQAINGTMMMPVRPVLESIGMNVSWNPDSYTVVISRASAY
ncbi:MAG: copper amine oxidase N-terminal domain-containing protein [Clostridiales bacterium]|jgi:hypothetical protein|nr:copper amine oxidase N-terminal domain-containing protein [Clostridiales bacterium]